MTDIFKVTKTQPRNNIIGSGGSRKVWWEGGCRYVFTKLARSAYRPAEGRSFEGVPGVTKNLH